MCGEREMRKDDGGRRKEGKRERRSCEVGLQHMFWVSHKSRKLGLAGSRVGDKIGRGPVISRGSCAFAERI